MELADIYKKYPNHVNHLLTAGWVDGEAEYYTKEIVFEGQYGEKQVASIVYLCKGRGTVLKDDLGKIVVYKNTNTKDRHTGEYILEQIK